MKKNPEGGNTPGSEARAEVWVLSDSERARNDLVEYYLPPSNRSICSHLSPERLKEGDGKEAVDELDS